ncbi:MAG: double-strand break repair protein AddB [Methylovirgula sp.]|uniref:double-strand break repair protein AddB n=1 Tax=Methylovirgula sp. TaxID=1978224 RepID=UPI0030768540
MPQKKVFTIAPGAPFLECFVGALLDGRIVAGFSRALSALELADATIYVPTQRAARALADEFARALGRPATLLPRILPLGGLEATENDLIFAMPGFAAPDTSLPQAANDIWRRMQLAHLVHIWAKALQGAVISIDADGRRDADPREPCLVGTSAADAWHLGGELAALIDEMIIEDVAWAQLDPLVLPDFDQYWRITLDFLNIAIGEWPKILASHYLIDAAQRQVLLVEAQIAQIQARQTKGPIIAIGSTGTNRATARLLAALAAAPNGAVVLPGLDQNLDETAWRQIGSTDVGDPGFGHPQAALRRLLSMLGVSRAEVTELGEPTPLAAARARVVSEALRPADTTEEWTRFRASPAFSQIDAALEGLSLIEAADEREEALALAIVLREVLETPGATAALVTPDRDLARRVGAELTRFGIEIDDSAGEPLNASATGSLALRAIDTAVRGEGADLVALLGHPMTRLGLAREEILERAPLFEIGVLRQERHAATFPTQAAAIAAYRKDSQSPFAHPAQKALDDIDWTKIADLLDRLEAALAPLKAVTGTQDLQTWIGAHRAALTAIAGEGGLRGDDAMALEDLFDELIQAQAPELRFDAQSYGIFLAQVMGERVLRRARRTHPRLKIFGLLEARLMPADVILLGGLDETVWPPQAQSDAFLNRPMRQALGLTPPERRIGQTAHDFVMAMGHERVILSRAKKRDGTPMVESRFVQRLAALAGDAFKVCRNKGEHYLDLARALDRPHAEVPPIKRPAPKPALDLRPQRLSVTRIETLRRDPYAIYAEFCLKLRELPQPAEIGDRRSIGNFLHSALEDFGRLYAIGALPEDAATIFTEILDAKFKDERADPDFAAFAWPRLQAAAAFYLDFESRRRPMLTKIDVENKSTINIVLGDGTSFTLSATADRIEHHGDGSVSLIDYKTGTPPSVSEVRVGFAPQLTLEAAMARRGAFELAHGIEVAEAIYVKLFSRDGGAERPLIFKNPPESLAEISERHFNELLALLNQFRDPATGYPARPYPKFAARYNAYDHLARVKEWAASREDGA